MRYLLAGVLVVMAARASRADSLVGKTGDEVRKAMGEPTWEQLCIDGLAHTYAFGYDQTDGLGGKCSITISFDSNERVKNVSASYRPFADRPPWLDALRNAFSPRPAP